MKHIFTLSAALLLVTISSAQININAGLKAYYPFNGNAKDSTGNGNDGTEMGVSLATDKNSNANSCYFFDGADHYINVPADSTIQPKNAVSVSAWVNTTDKDYWNFAVCKRLNLAKEPGNSYFLGTTGPIQGGSKWQWSISSSTTQHFLVTNTLVEDSTWLHLVGTFDGDTLQLYLNGQSIGSKVISNTTISYSNLSLRLGLGIPTSSGNKTAWKGYMDEIRIYERELSTDEIKYLYNPALLSTKEVSVPNIDINVYPNPTNNLLFLSSPVALDVLAKSTISITDVLGKQLLNTPYSASGIDISNLPNGVYFISISGFSNSYRFVKE